MHSWSITITQFGADRGLKNAHKALRRSGWRGTLARPGEQEGLPHSILGDPAFVVNRSTIPLYGDPDAHRNVHGDRTTVVL